jgi:hypothetical protein
MVTTEEIEELIVKLHIQGKNMREISKHEGVHKNFTFIGAVLRKRFPEEYPDTDNSEENKETEALKLFSEKKRPTEVAIKIGLNYEETEKIYLDYWRLEVQYRM